jgi:hypothetical protein
MPRISAPSQQKALRNHPSWENDKDAKFAFGPVIAKWLASGVLEYVAWDDRMPILLQPCGAVPKGTAPFYRLITDARFANKFYSDWGVTYTTALSSAARSTGATSTSRLTSRTHTTSPSGPIAAGS